MKRYESRATECTWYLEESPTGTLMQADEVLPMIALLEASLQKAEETLAKHVRAYPDQPDLRPDWVPAGNHYIIVSRTDGCENHPTGFLEHHERLSGEPIERPIRGPISWEMYLGGESHYQEVVERRARSIAHMNGGAACIARLVFVEEVKP